MVVDTATLTDNEDDLPEIDAGATNEAHSDVPVRQNYGPVRFLTDRSWSIKIL